MSLLRGGRADPASQGRGPLGARKQAAARISALGFVLVTTAACGASRPAAVRPDPRTVGALLAIARRFDADYAANRDGPVYDRFDAASRAVITRAEYIRRHHECPSAPGPATVLGANRVDHGYFAVRYSISGTQLTDYWHYLGGHWRFSLLRSNPGAVALYRLPAHRYLVALGCAAAH